MRTVAPRSLRRTACLLLASGAPACASGPEPTPAVSPADPDEGVELRVVNSRTQDIDIYVLSVGATRYRLGRVRAAGRVSMTIPGEIVESSAIAFLAQPMGYGDPLISREVIIAPGVVVQWQLANNLALSTLTVIR